ncbi:MAG: MATE family efflux transporter [Cyanobacteria bacterium J06621_11]
MITVSGMVMGVSPLVAEAFGAGKSARIRQLTHQGLWLALLISIPAMFATGHLDVWMRHTGQTATTLALADTYLNIILWSLFPITGFAALRSTVAAMSQARPILLIIVVGTLFNIVGNYVLGFGRLGLPAMGLAGLAIATVVAWWAMFTALLLYVLWHPAFRRYRFFRSVRSVGSRGVGLCRINLRSINLRRINLRVLWQLLSIGVPIGVFSGLEMGFFMVVTFLAGTLGTEVLAAHQIVFQTIVVVYMVPLGVSYAATVRVGQWLGRRDLVSLRRAVQIGMVLSTLCMVSASAAFLLFPKQIVGLYLDVQAPENAAIVALALPLLVVAAIAQILDGFQKAVYGSLQGLQDTQVPMVLNILGYWGVGLSVGYVLAFRLGMGSVGLWVGQSVAIAVVAGFFTWRWQWQYRRLLNRQNTVSQDQASSDQASECFSAN